MHPGGWSADVCEAAAAACAASATPPPPAAARALGVGCEGLASLWHQRRGAAARARAADARRRAPEFARAWRGGAALASVAARADQDAATVARLLVEVVDRRTRGEAKAAVRAPATILDARLRREVAAAAGGGAAARAAAARREVGLEYERLLRRALERARVPFADEDDLRARGFARTPDVLLALPLAAVGGGAARPVHWLDSKAMFGAREAYERDHRQQLRAYANRLGPGAVVYWFGFDAGLQGLDGDVLVLDGWPPAAELCWPDGAPVGA